jgi:hypothetical protein
VYAIAVAVAFVLTCLPACVVGPHVWPVVYAVAVAFVLTFSCLPGLFRMSGL